MKKLFLLLNLLIFNISFSQNLSETVPISETFSSNGKFKLKSISYDGEFPNLKGESIVSYTDDYGHLDRKIFYRINRSFDLYDDCFYFVAISNDGRKIIYITNEVFSKDNEHKNVTYYVDGKLVKAFNSTEFINCNNNEEKCGMFYDNRNEVVYDYPFSTSTVKIYTKNSTLKERFLSKNYVFNLDDIIYVIDPRKKVTLFDLNNNKFVNTNIDFDSIYPRIKDFEVIKSKISYYKYPYKNVNDIENVINDKKLSESISEISNLKFVSMKDSTFHKYKLHKIELTGYLNRNGKFEIDSIKTDNIFNKNKITEYIQSTTFKTDFIPKEVDKIYLSYFFGGYRNFDIKIAEEETINENKIKIEEFKKRLTLEKIDGIYIPKNLYECMTELDKTLNFENKKKLKESPETSQFNSHMGGLGMWIRNNWGINGGSRLSKYFHNRKIGIDMFGNDEISGIIIEQYIKWLKGDKNSWKKWEKENPALRSVP